MKIDPLAYGVPLGGASNERGVVDDGNFWRLVSGYFFGYFRDKASSVATCYPLLACH